MLTYKNYFIKDIYNDIINTQLNAKEFTSVALFICQNKYTEDISTFFKPFIDTLPEDKHTYGFFYTKEEKDIIKNSYFDKLVKENKLDSQKEYNKIKVLITII
jgi:hypothetical protein